MKDSQKLEVVLFETRPYVEYWDRLEKLVKELWRKAENEEEFIERLKEELQRVEEPFKTDLRIFLQKLEAIED
ncbi:hypothetical protein [Thermococcus sp.]|uniref:hypothetical protein n=1 Tax=Thermococcus sp. TaxID=35749 RepID=UPI0025DB51D7|nr:hypothetical protein [Thermococcus sp.]